MIEAPLLPEEADRLKALYKYDILDTEPEGIFDDVVELASCICNTPIALISLIDADRQWFKAKIGLDASQTDRSMAFCSHAILNDHILEVSDALEDERFADNPLVTGDPNIRFYAGAPVITNDGYKLGTICAIDTVPHKLNKNQQKALRSLANQVRANLDLRFRTERLKELNEEKNRFFSMLAHDLRSPVKNLIGLCEYLEECFEKMEAEVMRDTLQDMKQISGKVDKLMADILSWIRFDRGEMLYKPTTLNLRNTVYGVRDLLGYLAVQKQITLSINCPENIEVMADSTMLHSIIQNLLTNALKFTHPGGSASINCEFDGSKVSIEFSDTGVGIPASSIESAFSIGSSFTTDGTSGEQGSGLGLALCKEFAEKMGGSISIESELGHGTQVKVVLPTP